MIACDIAPLLDSPTVGWGAQTLTVNLSLAQAPSGASGVGSTSLSSGQVTIPATFPLYAQGTQTIGTGSKTALYTGTTSPLRYCYLKNLDDFNYVSVYSNSSGSNEMIRLYPGDPAIFPIPPSGTLYAQANNNSVLLQTYFVAG
jgi:hypothetical protein